MNNKKLSEFNQGYIEHQYKIIDALIEHQDKLDITNKTEYNLFMMLQTPILNNIFRVKGVINALNEVLGEKLEIPEKYQKYAKIAKELAYFKGDNIVLFLTDGETEQEIDVVELINKVKSIKKDETKPK